MKKTKLCISLFLAVFVTTILSGCTAPAAENDVSDTIPVIASETAETAVQDPTAVPEAKPQLSDQPYAIASRAFSINLPAGWNCSEIGAFQVDCQSPDGNAEMRVRVTATGYELTDESLAAFAHAELVSRYEDVKEYREIDKTRGDGNLVSKASWRIGEDYWESTDTFKRSSSAILHISVNTVAPDYEKYAPLFLQVVESAEVYPENLPADAFYAFTKPYTARESFFKLSVPTSWSKFTDGVSIQQTIVEGFTSPDKRASVQVALYKQGININIEAKGMKTRETMFALYGYDLKNASDVSLPDGRERLTWYAEKKDIYGISDFDAYGNTLYVLSIVWEPSSEALYLPILEEILDSFSRE